MLDASLRRYSFAFPGRTIFCLAILLAVRNGAAAELSRANLDKSLAALLAVGAQAEGSEAAVDAWQQVASAAPKQLPRILAALDDAGPLAANYLRAAVDTIAERAIAERDLPGGKLPAQELEAFVLETSHSPKGRRLAYEWLKHADPTAEERLVPGFLHDPGVEFRRDAVAKILEEAAALPADAEPSQAIGTYELALSGARDLDQIQLIAGKLKELGRPCDLPAHFGFIQQWKLIGPFDNTGGIGYAAVYPPEEELAFDKKYPGKSAEIGWQVHESTHEFGLVDCNAALGKANGATAYAATEFTSEDERTVEFRLACICASKLWLNGELIDQHEVYHSGSSLDQYVSLGRLKPGKNVIVLKVLQNEQTEDWAQDWAFQLRVCDASGTAILSADRTGAAPAGAGS